MKTFDYKKHNLDTDTKIKIVMATVLCWLYCYSKGVKNDNQ